MRNASTLFSCSNIVFAIIVILTCVDVIVMKRASQTPYLTNIHVTDALLSEFTIITTNNTNILHYNLSLHITLRNLNKDFGTHYDNIAVMAYYQGKKFVAQSYSHIFYQEVNGISLLKLSFKGQQDMDATHGVDKHLNSEAKQHQCADKHLNSEAKQHQCARDEDNVGSANNAYDIVVRLYLQNIAIRKLVFQRNWNVNSQFICDLRKVALVKSGNCFPNTFKSTECDSDFLQVYRAPGNHFKFLV